MTGIEYKSREEEEAEMTYGPAVVAFGLLGVSLTLTLWPIGVIGPLAVILIGLIVWIRESIHQNRTLVPSEERRGFPERFGLRTPTTYWWGAAGFGLIQVVVTSATLRTAHAHGLLDPSLSGVPVDLWIGHTSTLVVLATTAVGWWAVRSGASRAGGPSLVAVVLVVAGILVHLGLLGLQVWSFWQGPFFVDDLPRGSAAGLVFGMHAVFTFGILVAWALFLMRMRLAPLHQTPWGFAQGLFLFWGTVALSWLLVYVTIYLRLIQIDSYLI